MNADERTARITWRANSIGYNVLWWGLLLILSYRWLILGQNLMEHLDIVVIWWGSAILVGTLYAIRGVPVAGFSLGKASQVFLLASPTVSGILAVVIAFLAGGVQTFFQGLKVFAIPFLIVLGLVFIWQRIYLWWEKRHLD